MSGRIPDLRDQNAIDEAYFGIEAMQGVVAAVQQAVGAGALKGTGTMNCPQCKDKHGLTSVLTYRWEKRGKGTRSLTYMGWCSRDGCIRFSGH
jgi:hypothetical protein